MYENSLHDWRKCTECRGGEKEDLEHWKVGKASLVTRGKERLARGGGRNTNETHVVSTHVQRRFPAGWKKLQPAGKCKHAKHGILLPPETGPCVVLREKWEPAGEARKPFTQPFGAP